MLARLVRALRATPEDPEVADALEAALLRAGRLDEAYLLRWRRGEPSPVAAAVAASQRATLDALAADPACAVVECQCGDPECGGGTVPVRLVTADLSPGQGGWAPEERRHAFGAVGPLVGVRLRGAPGTLARLGDVGTLVRVDAAPAELAGCVLRTIEELDLWLEERDRPDASLSLPALRSLRLNGGRLTDELLEQLLVALPHLEELRVGGPLLTDGGLEALGGLARLRRLEVWTAPWLEGSGLAAVVDSGAPLDWLRLSGERLGDRAFAYIGELGTLTGLELDGVGLDLERARDLAGLPRLRALDVDGRGLTTDALELLEEPPLEDVCLGGAHDLPPGAFERVAGWPQLRRLSLTGPGPARGLSPLGLAPRLERLVLGWRLALSDEELVGLSRSRTLRELELHSVGLGPSAFSALARLPSLGTLALSVDALPDGALGALSWAPALTELTLTVNAALPEGDLARLADLPQLERLGVCGRLNPGSLAGLAGAPRLRALRVRGPLDARSLAGLAACPALEELLLVGRDLPPDERQRVQAALPAVRVARAREM